MLHVSKKKNQYVHTGQTSMFSLPGPFKVPAYVVCVGGKHQVELMGKVLFADIHFIETMPKIDVLP